MVVRMKETRELFEVAPIYGVLFLLLSTQVQTGAGETGCPRDLPGTTVMKRNGDLCYQFVSQEKFWFEARDYCLQNGGRLVRIDSSEINDFVVRTLNALWWRNNGVWIGLNDLNKEMQFQWTGHNWYENEPAGGWSNWGRGHPGAFLHSFRDCVRMVRDGGMWKWHETPCSVMKWHYRFICEYRATLHNEGIKLSLTRDNPEPMELKDISTRKEPPPPTTPAMTTAEETTIIDTGKQTESTTVAHVQLESHVTEIVESTWIAAVFATDLPPSMTDRKDTNEALSVVRMRESLVEDTTKDVRTETVTLTCSMIAFCMAFVGIVVALVLLWRRRKWNKASGSAKSPDSTEEDAKDKLSGKKSQTVSSAVPNIYVISVQNAASSLEKNPGTRPLPAPTSKASDDDASSVHVRGTTEYDDTPKAANIYDEIPEADHLYESLDEVI